MGRTLEVALVLGLAAVSLALMRHRTLKSYAFTTWVFTFVAAALVWPTAFLKWGSVDLTSFIGPLVQIIMFGMGTKLSLGDFGRVFLMPWPVFIAMFLHYTVMPLTGYTIAKVFGFPAEIAAGVILIGSVSSGTASNLIAYLSGANVALAVTVTACSTLVSPIMTPFLMKTLAGRMVPINFVNMMIEILNMVIVPVVSGLIANRILYSSRAWCNRARWLGGIALAAALLAAGFVLAPVSGFEAINTLRKGAVVGTSLIALVALAKLVVSVLLRRPNTWMDRTLPLVSMVGICIILGIITARSSDKLLKVGPLLVFAAMLHNAVGYFFGYWLARAVRLDQITCRTIAIETGMQNGGMASGLAMTVLKSADAALAPAIFGSWMNVSGSILASWWRRHRIAPTASPATACPLPETASATTEPAARE